MQEILDKYSEHVLNNISQDNMQKIITFLQENNCNFIEDIINDYIDLFSIDYNEFINIFEKLNNKYNNNFFALASNDINMLEEFWCD